MQTTQKAGKEEANEDDVRFKKFVGSFLSRRFSFCFFELEEFF